VSAVPLDDPGEDIIEPLNTLLLTFSAAGVKAGVDLSTVLAKQRPLVEV
jgi:hypothetical protein